MTTQGRGRRWNGAKVALSLWMAGQGSAFASAWIPIQFESKVGNGAVQRELLVIPTTEAQWKNKQEIYEKLKDGRSTSFRGMSLSAWVDEAMQKLTAAERAQVDLVVIRGSDPKSTRFLPRAFLVKFPKIMLAFSEGGKPISDAPRVILPRLTKTAAQDREGVLFDPLQVSGVQEIILTSYELRVGSARLERRMDPSAMRGEKLFLQNCLSCHATGAAAPLSIGGGDQGLASFVSFLGKHEHPVVDGLKDLKLEFNEKQLRSIDAYLRAKATEQKPVPEPAN